MTETSEDRKHTAYHEAGHVVAHCRLNIPQGEASIKPNPHERILGNVLAEGVKHVWDAKYAHEIALGYCAGYAALIAAGYSDEVARQGAGDDFENVEELIDKWSLPEPLEDLLDQSVILMSRPENIRVVDSIAKKLMKYETLDSDYIDRLVDRVDGTITDEDWRQYLHLRGMLT